MPDRLIGTITKLHYYADQWIPNSTNETLKLTITDLKRIEKEVEMSCYITLTTMTKK